MLTPGTALVSSCLVELVYHMKLVLISKFCGKFVAQVYCTVLYGPKFRTVVADGVNSTENEGTMEREKERERERERGYCNRTIAKTSAKIYAGKMSNRIQNTTCSTKV